MVKIRVFVSSPGDVSVERICAERVIERLRLEYSGRVSLEGFFWEHEPMRATASFNDPQNIPPTAEFDIVVCILWSRLGTMLSRKFQRNNGEPYPSGTAFEIETAAEAYRKMQRPDIIVFRRTQEVPMPVNDPAEAKRRSDQLAALNQFIEDWFFDEDSAFKAAINEYEALGQFELKLERPLRKLILKRIEEASEEELGAPSALPVTYHGENPFRGLEAYDFEDASIFFGRSQAIEDVLTTMKKQAEAGHAFALVHGASGSGKSSLMRAGVVPVMTHMSCAVEGVACWRVAAMTPGSSGGDLLQDLAESLMAENALPDIRREMSAPDFLHKKLRENPAETIALITKGLQSAAQGVQSMEGLPAMPITRLVLLVDQLEQIFSDDRRFPREQREEFAIAIGALARSGIVWVVATIRSDQLGTFTEDLPELAELSQGGQYSLLAPTEKDMDVMIRLPARAAGVVFEEDPVTKQQLDTRLLREARDAPDGLPLLSFVLRELYARREKVGGVWTMTHTRLDELGGLEGAVKTRAEAIYADFKKENPDEKEPLVNLARKLVTLGRGKDGAALRRLAPLSVFGAGDSGRMLKLVDALVEGRLLTKMAGESNEPVVFVTHEALLRKWEALEKAIEANRSFLILRARAATAATDWLEKNRSSDFLWNRGESLADARRLKADFADLDAIEKEFVDASIRSGGVRLWMRVGIGISVLAVVGGVVAWKLSGDEKSAATAMARIERQEKFKDLESQLGPAVATLENSIWEGQSEENPAEGEAYPASFPAASVAEISRRILKVDPKHAEAFHTSVLATIHDRSGLLTNEEKQAAVRQQFGQWDSFGLPKSEILNLEGQLQWELGNFSDAVISWRSYLQTPDLDDSLRRSLLTRVTGFYLDSENWDEVERIVTQSWAWEDNAVAKVRRAKARLKLFKLDLAQKDYADAKRAAPTNDLVLQLGPQLERLMKHRDAIEAATNALNTAEAKIQPDPWVNRCRYMLYTQDYEQAESDLQMAARNTAGKSTAIAFLQEMCSVRSGKGSENPKIVFLQAFSYGPDQFEEWLNQWWPTVEQILQLDKELEHAPNSTDKLISRSRALRDLAQHNLGLEDAEAAIRSDQSNYWGYFWKGVHLLNMQKYAEAMEVSGQLKDLQPAWYYHLQIAAEAHFGLGDTDAAVKTVTAALAFDKQYYLYEMRAKYLRKLQRFGEAELDDQAARELRKKF